MCKYVKIEDVDIQSADTVIIMLFTGQIRCYAMLMQGSPTHTPYLHTITVKTVDSTRLYLYLNCHSKPCETVVIVRCPKISSVQPSTHP
jgi:hypothetical protein